MRSILIIFLIISIGLSKLYAANSGEIKGEIFSAENEKPLENCIIRIVELKKISLTNNSGKYQLQNVKPGEYQIEFSRIGYRTERRKAKIIKDSVYTIDYKLIPVGVTSAEIVIASERSNSKFSEITDHATTLNGKELQRKLGATIAASLQNEAGMSSRSMGPAPARPVIRGLSGSRVVMAEDDVPTTDMSATSPDHAVGIEPFSSEKIEIIRGPKVLEYTTNSTGGVVNVVKNAIPNREFLSYNIEGSGFYESANNGRLGALSVSAPIDDFALNAKYSLRKTDDLYAGGKKLENSNIETQDYSIGSSYFIDKNRLGFGISEFSTKYGIPGGFVGAHPKGVDIDMLKRTIDAKGLLHFHGDMVDNAEINISRTYFKQTEYESNGSVGSQFVIKNYFGALKFNGFKNESIEENSFGLNFQIKDFEPGGYVFTPKTSSLSLSPFYFIDFNIGNHYLQAGVRYSYDKYTPDKIELNSKIGVIDEKEFHSLAASISIMNKIGDSFFAGVNFSATSRAPALEEVFSQGPHLAAYSFEVGNPNLKEEYGFGAEIFTYVKSEAIYSMFNIFINELPYYIAARNTGKINYQQLLPIYAYSGMHARLFGFDTKTEYKLNSALELSFIASYTVGLNIDEDSYLPAIPPLKGIVELKYSNMNFNCGINSELACVQNNVDKFEATTPGYVSFGAYTQYLYNLNNLALTFSLTIDNIFDTDKRNHLSRIKSILPDPGRNLRLVTKIFI